MPNSKELVSREETEFPKSCPTCGRFYASATEYIAETKKLAGAHGGIKEVPDDSGVFLEIFRNCVCGSTLMSMFENRRDNSEKGDLRRKLFDDCLDAMTKSGIDMEEARVMLRRLIKNDF